MGIYDQIKKAFQDIVAPEIRALQGEIKRLDEKIDGVRREGESLRREMLARSEATDQKIDSLRGELESFRRETASRFEATDQKIDGVRAEVESFRRETASRFEALDVKFTAEIRRLDSRIDALDRELKTAIEVRERVAILETKLASR